MRARYVNLRLPPVAYKTRYYSYAYINAHYGIINNIDKKKTVLILIHNTKITAPHKNVKFKRAQNALKYKPFERLISN